MFANRGARSTLSVCRVLHSTCYHATSLHQVRSWTDSPSVQPVPELQGPIETNALKHHIWEPNKPLVMRNTHSLPAMNKWFSRGNDDNDDIKTHFTEYFLRYKTTIVPYEFTSQPSQSQIWSSFIEWSKDGELECLIQPLLSSQDNASHFHQLYAPLALLQLASEYNQSKLAEEQLTHLYVAQSEIRDLPEDLLKDLEAPEIVKHSPKGDVYASSIWLGLQPTYTPLHTDPNPNIFCQLHGHKIVRLVAPKSGISIFNRIQRKLGMQGNPKLRGTEMMEGPERDMLHEAVWSAGAATGQLQEATVGPGDVLFIPKGWWHSFVSQGKAGDVNASANWWCR